MRRPIRNVRQWSADPRSIGLIALGIVYIRVMIIYLPWAADYRTSVLPVPLEILHLPLWIYAIFWGLSGVMTLYIGLGQVAVRHPLRWLMAGSVAMPILWATFYFLGWIFADFKNLDWSTSLLYLMLAVIVTCFIEIPPARLYRNQ